MENRRYRSCSEPGVERISTCSPDMGTWLRSQGSRQENHSRSPAAQSVAYSGSWLAGAARLAGGRLG
jgi:hypothetical protein